MKRARNTTFSLLMVTTQRLVTLFACLCCLASPAALARDVQVGIYDNKPKIFTDAGGQPAGLLVDLLKAVAEKESWTLKFIPCIWQECLHATQEGSIDLMPDMAYTENRDLIFDFHATPALISWSQVYRHADTPIISLFDLQDKRIAVLAGSIQEAIISQMLSSFGIKATLLPMRSLHEAFALVENRKADVAVANHNFGEYHAADFRLKDTPIVFQPAKLFFATAQGQNKDLLDSIDRHLGIWQRDQNSPYFSILKRWGPAAHHTAIPTAIWWTLGTIALLFALASTTTVIARREVARQTKSLRASEARFRGVFDAVSEGILIHERTTGKLLQVNQRTCEMFGCTESEVIGSSIERLSSGIPPYSSQEANTKLKQAADSGPQQFVWQGKRLDNGALFWIDVNLRRTHLGDQDCILAVVRECAQEPASEAGLAVKA